MNIFLVTLQTVNFFRLVTKSFLVDVKIFLSLFTAFSLTWSQFIDNLAFSVFFEGLSVASEFRDYSSVASSFFLNFML